MKLIGIINLRENTQSCAAVSRVYESSMDFHKVINKHVNPNGYSCSSENQTRNYQL